MSHFFRLVCDFEVLTPMFLGGANQNTAELRVPSIKGAMRFWYRAFDPEFKTREPLYFGSGGRDAGQSLLIVRCRLGEGTKPPKNWSELHQDSIRQTTDGLVYLGYPFGMRNNKERKAFLPGTRFTVEVSCHRSAPGESKHGPTQLRAALASMWALGHFGALGSRARRGFGAVALLKWKIEDRGGAALSGTADLEDLPLLYRTSTPDDWSARARQGIATLGRWFGTFEEKVRHPHHPCFGSKADLVVWSKYARGDWHNALQSLGGELQNARRQKPPDYALVKDHVRFEAGNAGRCIERAPNRATFGLPLTFRYRSLPRGQEVTFFPAKGKRHGSLLFLRPVLGNGALFGLFLRLDGDVPGIDPPARLPSTGRLKPAVNNAMDDFVREMKRKAGQ